MRYDLVRRAAILMVGAGLMLGGCATKEDVEHAQATADSARQEAGAAMGAAQQAQATANQALSTAQAAQSTAQGAQADAARANARLDKFGERHKVWRHHRRRHRQKGERG
jgi:multidrug resistance efflux pump